MSKGSNKLWNIGIKDDSTTHLNLQIVLTNQIAIGQGILFLAFAVVSFWVQPWKHGMMNLTPAMGLLIPILVISLNIQNLFGVTKAVLSLLPGIFIILIHGFIIPVGNPPVAGFFIVQAGLAIIPFLFYELKDWPNLCLFGLLHLFGFLCFNVCNDLLETSLNSNTNEVSIFGITATILGIANLALVIYGFIVSRRFSLNKLQLLSKEQRQDKERLQKSENKLKDYIAKTEEAQQAEKLRIWESEGIAKFGTLLRTHNNDKDVYDILTSELVKYLEVSQGSFYLVREETGNKYLEMEGCYAFNRKKYLHQKIKIGEGLVGQCYLEKLPTYLENVPDNYLKIRSGLGDAAPRSIIIIPLIHDDQVEGIMEFASFTKLEEHKTLFLEKLSINVASWVSTHRINQETKELYDKSQEHAQQMHEQEEEMRQNLEELAATQEDMKRKEDELKVLLKASQNQLVKQNLAEIKVQIENDLEGAKKELRFLSNVPPIEGIFRSEDNDGFDPKGKCQKEVWVERFSKIIQGLLDHKKIYHAIHFYADDHIISMKGCGESQSVKKLGDTSDHEKQLAKLIVDCKSCDIYVDEPKNNKQFNFIIQLGLAIKYQGNQRGILVIELLGDELIEKINAKETENSGFMVQNSQGETLYQHQRSHSFKQTELNTAIMLNQEYNFQLIVAYLTSEFAEQHL